MHVASIMTKKVVSVVPGATVAEIAHLLFDKNLSGVPVVDDARQVVGIVTEYDLMSRHMSVHIPTYMSLLETIATSQGSTRIMDELEAVRRTTAEAIMTSPVVTVKEDTAVEEAARIFAGQRINPLPVVDKAGKLIGIVSRADIVKLFKR